MAVRSIAGTGQRDVESLTASALCEGVQGSPPGKHRDWVLLRVRQRQSYGHLLFVGLPIPAAAVGIQGPCPVTKSTEKNERLLSIRVEENSDATLAASEAERCGAVVVLILVARFVICLRVVIRTVESFCWRRLARL